MGYKVRLSPKAYADIADAFDYYKESIQTLLNLDNELNEAYRTISLTPNFRIRYKNITGYPLKRFPFLLLYEVDDFEETIYIYSVFNTYLNPKKYPGR
ncbi:type II toxin-antitoxin system RelE/ParE family toxin [Flavobacterium sp. MFBS3-15]|uniref:type II toxin-antitoxin system RelE/ParE family toxin n=1 Tax=Flavobacterium sp. MFBS3-15 TaxID=2989816 RepID=UPI0022364F2B|nr:type II toxin-antitoxin system RelE/ParE family toxin [Flavobacterium sp. MFBS3-15]MCW4469473.1 type II toxin-antitoxin system RelE/ParE family toxin [Flavobacterium sp. MFBS3-15]